MLTFILTLVALSVSVYSYARMPSKSELKALRAAKEERDELKTALANILDSDGNICGKMTLFKPKEEQNKFTPRDFKPRGIIEWWRSRNPDYFLDRTPCGLCENSFWAKKYRGTDTNPWRCKAHQGCSVDYSREYFLDRKNQCSMFSRKSKYLY